MSIVPLSHATATGIRTTIKSLVGKPMRYQIARSWNLSTDEFWKYQGEQFRRIYSHARRRVKFYRDRSHEYPDLPVGDHHVLELLAALPVLKKQTVREHNEDFWWLPPLPITSFHTTSGTSGTPLRIPGTIWERAFQQAIREDYWQRLTGRKRPRVLNLTGFLTPTPSDKDLYWVDRLTGDVYLSIYALKSEHREQIRELLQSLDPQLIYGYASAVHQLAMLFPEGTGAARDRRVAIVTSEVLETHWRHDIEALLCRRVYDFYGSQEASHWVMQCDHGQMHISPLVGIVEIVDEENKPAPAGACGRVLITSLRRWSMPLVRYEIGDIAESTGYDHDCSCGLRWPTIGKIQGRSEDLIRTRDGRRIALLSYHAMKDLSGVKESQIVQTDYESFVCNMVLDEKAPVDRDSIEEKVRSEIARRLQVPVKVSFRYLDTIPRGSNGKFKAVVVAFDPTSQDETHSMSEVSVSP